ncbi:hypothetical protein [Paenibacillus albidus]|uniref:hypothetical protein n=1 Tax=Paenibacillus albidus TaxID=2041023 RepID=UPI00166E5359|nr:hypothetical protein [Paenibacillus albidus]
MVLQHTYKDSKIAAIQVSSDEQLLAVGVFGGELAVWDLNSASRIARRDDFVWLGNPGWIGMTQTLAFSKDGRKLAYAALDHSIGIIHSTGGLEDERIHLEQDRTCCALSMDSLGTVIFAEYNHYQPFYLSRWSSGQEIVQRLFTGTGMNVEEIVINEERDELWVNHSPRVEIRKYSTAELIKLYDPYLWKYSRFIRNNAVSISGQASLAAISHEGKIRLG